MSGTLSWLVDYSEVSVADPTELSGRGQRILQIGETQSGFDN